MVTTARVLQLSMAFLALSSPTGERWSVRLEHAPATADASGLLEGVWGDCIVAATVYEHEHRDWGRDPAYKGNGPCGQVIDFLTERGHRSLERAAEKLEKATQKALKDAGDIAKGGFSSDASGARGVGSGAASDEQTSAFVSLADTGAPAPIDAALDSKIPTCKRGHLLAAKLLKRNRCDICRKSGTAFRCTKGCDYDMCQECFEAGGDGARGANSADSDSSSSGSSSGSSRSGSRSSSQGSACGDLSALLLGVGLKEPLPWQCTMNDLVENAKREAPPEVLVRLPAGVSIQKVKKVSDGWHEGYLLTLSRSDICTLPPGQLPQVILRIWRAQLSYWRLEVPTGSAVEQRAMAVAREAGVATAGFLEMPGDVLYGHCRRAPHGEDCDWACYNFVNHAKEKDAHRGVVSSCGSASAFMVKTMAQLHSLDLTGRDTGPLARFDDWREHCAYLAKLAEESGQADAVKAVAAATRSLEVHAVPDLPPALCHLDWHLGNALCDANGQLQALIDWEFAGVGDPRIDLARHCRRKRWTGDIVCRDKGSDLDDLAIWEAYAVARFGPGTDAIVALGPPEPFLALECAMVVATCAAVVGRTARFQAVPGVTESGDIPRCDLHEWFEDMETAKWHLRRMQLL